LEDELLDVAIPLVYDPFQLLVLAPNVHQPNTLIDREECHGSKHQKHNPWAIGRCGSTNGLCEQLPELIPVELQAIYPAARARGSNTFDAVCESGG
jgi:hypothetical protein